MLDYWPQVFISSLTLAAHICLASSFQPGSDYDAYKTSNLYNCSGNVPVSNVTVRNAVDTLPQIEPSTSKHGWEQWSLFLHGTLPILLRWNLGDPSCSASSTARFDLLVAGVNGTTVRSTLTGKLAYADKEHVKRIAIGDNSLTWDAGALWYNVSVSVDGYQLQLNSYSATLDTFHPNVAFHNGLLDKSSEWFASVPLLRGHASGRFTVPSKENSTRALEGLSVIKHMFSQKPLPSHINTYSGVTVWGYSSAFYDTHIYYQTKTTNGTGHEAAFLGRAIPIPGQRDEFASAWATYVVTDDPKLFHMSVDATTKEINTSFSGCTKTNDTPYQFNILTPTLLGEYTDHGGGRTSYYQIVNGTTTAWFNGVATKGAVAGIIEEYQAPSRSMGLGL